MMPQARPCRRSALRAPCRKAREPRRVRPTGSTIRSAGPACPQRSRRARRRREAATTPAGAQSFSVATAAARDHRGKRQTLPMRRGRRKRARPRVVSCARDLGGSGTSRRVDFGRGQAAGPTMGDVTIVQGLFMAGLTIRRTRRPQKFRGANCAARTPCIFYGRDVAGRADHEQLSPLLPVQPRISRHRLNACTGSMRADANDDHHSDAVSPSHRRQPHHPQSAPPRAAAWPRRRLFPFSQHKCA